MQQAMEAQRKLGEFAGLLSARIEALRPTSININREAFQEFAEFVPTPIWTAMCNGTIVYRNPAFREFSGRTDIDYSDILHPDDIGPMRQKWQTCVRREEAYKHQARVRGSDGHYHLVSTTARPVMDAHGRLSFWLGSAAVIVPRVDRAVRAA